MVQYQAANNGLGIDDMIALLTAKTWKAPRLKGLPGMVQHQNEQMMLTYLLAMSINDDASFATKAQLLNAIDDIKKYATAQLKTVTDNKDKGYMLLTLERIKSPEIAKPTMHEPAPPGSPIGCGMDF